MDLVSNNTMLEYLHIREQFEQALAQQYGCHVSVYGFQEVSNEDYMLAEQGIVPADHLCHTFEVTIRRTDRMKKETVRLLLSRSKVG